jgi:RNA polymerase sigma-70 factor (ECF subfamily)
MRAIPAVRVNRAFAVARASGAAAGLALLDDRSAIDAEGYPYVHLVRGALLEELCRIDEARDSLQRALSLARNEVERLQILGRIERLSTPNMESR